MTNDAPPIVFTKHLKRVQEEETISLLSSPLPTPTTERVVFFFFLINVISFDFYTRMFVCIIYKKYNI